MRKAAIFISLALLLLLSAAPALANGIPSLPHAFYGTVTVNGAPAADCTQVSATVDNGTVILNEQNPTTTLGGSYGIDSPKLLVQGDIQNGATITFHVTNDNGTAIGGTATFQAGGGPTRKNLSVTISPPPPTTTPPGGGGGGGAETPTPPGPGTTDLTGLVDNNGVFLETVIAYSSDGRVRITIPKGTVGKTSDGKPLTEITIVPVDAPSGADTINLLGQIYDIGPDGATFEPPISITIKYDPNTVPPDADMHIHYWDATSSDWIRCLGCTTDSVNCCVNNDQISHFTPFAILNVPPPETTTPAPTTPEPTTPAPTTPAPTTPEPTTPEPTTPAETAPTPPPVSPTSSTPATPAPAPSTNWPLIGGIIGGVIVVIIIIVLLVRKSR